MSGRQLCIRVMLCALMLVGSAVAQDRNDKNELGGVLGRTFISDQGIKNANFFDPIIHSGKGLSFNIEYARRFYVTQLYSLSGEVMFMYNPDEDLNAGSYPNAVVPTDYKQLFVTPAVRLNLFPVTAVSPWVSFGAGFGHFSEGNNLAYGGTNPGKSTSSATIEAGLGLDVKATRRVTLRAEARDFYSGEPDFPLASTGHSRQHNYFVGGGAFFRF